MSRLIYVSYLLILLFQLSLEKKHENDKELSEKAFLRKILLLVRRLNKVRRSRSFDAKKTVLPIKSGKKSRKSKRANNTSATVKTLTWTVRNSILLQSITILQDFAYQIEIEGLLGENYFSVDQGYMEGIDVVFSVDQEKKSITKSQLSVRLDTKDKVQLSISSSFLNPVSLRFKIETAVPSNTNLLVLIIIAAIAGVVFLFFLILWIVHKLTEKRRKINNLDTIGTRTFYNGLSRIGHLSRPVSRYYENRESFEDFQVGRDTGRTTSRQEAQIIKRSKSDIPVLRVSMNNFERDVKIVDVDSEDSQSKINTEDNGY